MDQMEENEIELETVVINDTADEGLLSTEKISTNVEEANKVEKIVRFPITRIKHLVKMDPDVNLCSQEALFLITKTTVIS
jgi:DNA polymerase epsilon subunit 4